MSSNAAPIPKPALVTQAAVRRLPRLALLLLCAAYVLPGLFGRDPWRGADITAFGQMLAMAEGRAPWLEPMLGGVPTQAALVPHWVGALAILATQGWLDPALAARLPFALLLVLTLAAVWYASFNLALSEAAQPLPLAFGGEAKAVDYARAIADGAVLAAVATLGLLQLGHETTPELAQLAAMACWLWALAAAPRRDAPARWGVLLSLPTLAACGAPSIALALGAGALALSLTSPSSGLRPLWPWLSVSGVLAAVAAWTAGSWAWRLAGGIDVAGLLRLWLWFLWPAGLLALWTVWRWRRHLGHRHLMLPLLAAVVPLLASTLMGGSDRALMLALPAIAVLAAFALPTLKRGATAAIDWFSVFFFTACALTIWIFFIAMQTGVPPRQAATVLRLATGFKPVLVWMDLLPAVLGTLAWAWLVRWRTGRHREALWKSQVLPAGGVALCWLLLMTLWLPLLDYGRSNRPIVARVMRLAPADGCIAAPGVSTSLVAALEWHGRRRVDARPQALTQATCPLMVSTQRGTAASVTSARAQQAGWQEVAREKRPTDRQEVTIIWRRPGTVTPAR